MRMRQSKSPHAFDFSACDCRRNTANTFSVERPRPNTFFPTSASENEPDSTQSRNRSTKNGRFVKTILQHSVMRSLQKHPKLTQTQTASARRTCACQVRVLVSALETRPRHQKRSA